MGTLSNYSAHSPESEPDWHDIADRLRERETHYRTLFDSIDQGFCIVEVLFDDNEYPRDYRFLEVNAAFEAQTGLVEATGKTMRSLRPDHEDHWFEIYGRIALTGEPVRFENPAAALGRWYDVYAFRIDALEQRHVAILFDDISARKRDEEKLALLATEVDHRAKNLLTVVMSIARMTRADTLAEYKQALLGRLQALAASQRLLSKNRWQEADAGSLVEEELSAYKAPGNERVQWAGPTVPLAPAAAQCLAMTLHELATNAAKHGALSVPRGRVAVEWRRNDDGKLGLRWSESRGPTVVAPSRQGTGTGVIMRCIQDQLGGEVTVDWRPQGLICELVMPTGFSAS